MKQANGLTHYEMLENGTAQTGIPRVRKAFF